MINQAYKTKRLFFLLLLSTALFLGACGTKPGEDGTSAESEGLGAEGADEAGEAGAEDTPVPTPPASGAEEETAKGDAVTEEAFYGTWEIMDYQTASSTGHVLDECNVFLNSTVTYRADAVLQNDEEITGEEAPVYEKEETPYTYDLFLENYSVNLGDWWNGVESVSCVTVGAEEPFFGDCLFVVDHDTLWIYYGEAVYLAKRCQPISPADIPIGQ